MKEKRSSASIIRAYGQSLFTKALRNLDGTITIVWDRLLMKQMSVLISINSLKEKYNIVRNLSLDDAGGATLDGKTTHVVYCVAPLMSSLEKLMRNYLQKLPEHDLRLHHVFFIPDVNYVLRERLKQDQRIWSRLESISSISTHWFPTDMPNVIYVPLPALPDQLLVDGNWNFLYKSALALYQLMKKLIADRGPAESSIIILDGSSNSSCDSKRSAPVYCKGEWSTRIGEMLRKIEVEEERAATEGGDFTHTAITLLNGSAAGDELLDVDSVVIIDRWLDLMTPMITQFTFGGAVEELFGIDIDGRCGITEAQSEDKDINSPSRAQEGESSSGKNSNSPTIQLRGEIYERLQDLHINAVAGEMKKILNELHEDEKCMKLLQQISDIKKFIGQKMPDFYQKRQWTSKFLKVAEMVQREQSDDFFIGVVNCEREILSNPSNCGDKLLPFIEMAIIEARPATTVLRLIALQSLVAPKGIRTSVLHGYRKLFVHSYGIFTLKWWLKLQIAGILREDATSSDAVNRLEVRYPATNYSALTKRHRLDYPEVNEIRADDSSYAYNGRASLLIRYIEDGVANNWREFTCVYPKSGRAPLAVDNSKSSIERSTRSLGSTRWTGGGMLPQMLQQIGDDGGVGCQQNSKPQRTLVFVVGGITRAEASMLRKCLPDKIALCASTAIINGHTLLDSFR